MTAPTRCRVLTQAQAAAAWLYPALVCAGIDRVRRRWHASLDGREDVLRSWGQGARLRDLGTWATIDDVTTLVRLLGGPPVIVDAMLTRGVADHAIVHPSVAEPRDTRRALGKHYDHRVLADALLARGHWLGEPLALWLSRPSGHSRIRWQRLAARAFVEAAPGPANAHVLRGDPVRVWSTREMPNDDRVDWDDFALLLARAHVPMPEGLDVAARVDAVCRDVFGGRSCLFTLTLRNDREWLVGFDTRMAGASPYGRPGRAVVAFSTGLE